MAIIPDIATISSLPLILAEDYQWSEADRTFMMVLKKGRSLNTEIRKLLEVLCYKQGELDLAFEMDGTMPPYTVR